MYVYTSETITTIKKMNISITPKFPGTTLYSHNSTSPCHAPPLSPGNPDLLSVTIDLFCHF